MVHDSLCTRIKKRSKKACVRASGTNTHEQIPANFGGPNIVNRSTEESGPSSHPNTAPNTQYAWSHSPWSAPLHNLSRIPASPVTHAHTHSREDGGIISSLPSTNLTTMIVSSTTLLCAHLTHHSISSLMSCHCDRPHTDTSAKICREK